MTTPTNIAAWQNATGCISAEGAEHRVKWLCAERDAAQARCVELERERDQLRSQLATVTAEVVRLREDCEALIGSPVGAWVSAQEMAERLLLIESAQRQRCVAEVMQDDSARSAQKFLDVEDYSRGQVDIAEIYGDELESALASAKPEPSTPERPGWVAASVLRAKADEWRLGSKRLLDRVRHCEDADEELRDADRLGWCADELTSIADNAGDAEAVERAAFELVDAKLRGYGVLEVYLNGNIQNDCEGGTLYAAYRALAGKGGEVSDEGAGVEVGNDA